MFTLTFLLNGYTQATRWSASVIKVGVDGVGICISIKKAGLGATDKWLHVICNIMLFKNICSTY